jgi:hypothetical protein
MFHVGQAGKLNPITRVVQLLEGMAKKIEQDGKIEEEIFDKYVCWAQTVIKTKTATNEAASARIEELNAYIDDIESGRVEFTSERTDLEAAIKALTEEIETADEMREKEANDFAAAKDEMEKAIAALEQVVEVLGEATKEHKGSLLSIKREIQTFQEGVHTGASLALKNALALGQRYLSKGDALFLQRMLTGEVPKADWKKLNRKSTFKSKYKARSGKIQKLLADMLQTFKDNLADAEKKESAAANSYDKLKDSKSTQLESSQQALADGDQEGSARKVAKEDAKQEVEDLEAQVKADEGYIQQTEDALKEQKKGWKERCKLRTLEIASINKAIAILNSDDARDTMKSSFEDGPYLLIQKLSNGASKQRASAMLRQIRALTWDPRLTSLTVLLQVATGPLAEVIKAIDKMIATLKEEETADLETKETCEKEREESTASARDSSVEIDDATDAITKNLARITELKSLIDGKVAENKQLADDLAEATRNRETEKAAFESSVTDDKAAAKLIAQAKDVLAEFYTDNGLALVQKNQGSSRIEKASQPPTDIQAGKPPPPPPQTFEEPYGGAKGASQGIQAILELILGDVQADIEKAEKEEEAAVEEFAELKKHTEDATAANTKAIEDMKGEISTCETTVEQTKTERINAKGALDSVMNEIKLAQPSCEFMTVNFEVRTKNRHLEIDGLLKAKAILQS